MILSQQLFKMSSSNLNTPNQHDGAPAHFAVQVRTDLAQRFGHRWIARGGAVSWPPRSPDLTSLDFFLWGHVKSLVYETPVETEQDLIGQITAAFEIIQNEYQIFNQVRLNHVRRLNRCIQVEDILNNCCDDIVYKRQKLNALYPI